MASVYAIGGNFPVAATITLNSEENSITVSSIATSEGVTGKMPTGSWTSYVVYEE
jgi:hypothetical protein